MKKSHKQVLGIVAGCVVALFGTRFVRHRIAEPEIVIPPTTLPKPNAFDYYGKAGKLYDALVAKAPGADRIDITTDLRGKPNSTPQQLKQKYPTTAKLAWIRKCAPVLQTLRQGFAYEYREPPQRSLMSTRQYYTQYRALARLLVVESHTRSEQGDWAAASRSTLDGLHFGHDVPRGGPFISALVAYAVDAISRKELQSILPHLDAGAAKSAAAEIEKLEAERASIADTLREEKWSGVSGLNQLMGPPGVRSAFMALLFNKRKVMKNYVTYMDALAAESQKPYQKWKAPPMPKDPYNKMILPTLERSHFHATRDQTGNILLMVQLALRAFELERGRLPETLDELVPDYLKKVPVDPFGGGEKLHYKRNAKGYVLYSVGPDGKDNAGQPITRRKGLIKATTRYLVDDDSTGDFVAGINR